jgi:hypothetical protein
LSDDGGGEQDMDELLREMKDRAGGGARGNDENLTVSAQKSYQAFLGYYSGQQMNQYEGQGCVSGDCKRIIQCDGL